MVIALKQYTRHRVSLKKRDSHGLNAKHRMEISIICRGFVALGISYRESKENGILCVKRVKNTIFVRCRSFFSLLRDLLVNNEPIKSPSREGHVKLGV